LKKEVDAVKVILSENVPNVGEMGATVNVADGYARNFLLPRKLAVRADSASAKQIDHEKRMIRKREEKQRAALTEVAKQLESLTLEIKVRAGEEDKIFGSVTSAHIADALKAMGHDVDRRTVMLDEPIKSIGIFSVPVRLASGIEAGIKVWVSTLEEAE
jgi:large subunit ribosomal protein L9